MPAAFVPTPTHRPMTPNDPTHESAVLLEGVTKRFGAHLAIDSLSLNVPAGSCYGFIGPNGSGKTTTLRTIMRILEQDAGDVTVLGRRNTARPDDRVGYLPEERGLYKQMKVREVLKFYAAIKGADASNSAINAWLEKLDLGSWGEKRVEQLSKGMSQKVQFIATVISRPRLVLLDEVFSGLDPVNREVMTEQILELRRDGVTVIFSTHDMSTAELMCDRIFMIYKGRKVLDDTLEEIHRRFGEDTLRVVVDGANGQAMHHLPGVSAVRDMGRVQELRLLPGTDEQAVLAELQRLGRVTSFQVTQPSLQDVFIRIARPLAEEIEPAAEPEAEALVA